MIDNKSLVWPPLPDAQANDPQLELKKLRYQAQLQTVTAQYEAIIERDKTVRTHYEALDQAVYTAYLDVAKGHLDRVQARAQFVATAASAIGGVYAAVLGLSFSIGKEINRPLPIRGLASTIFLGLSIVLATAYLAYITRAEPIVGAPVPSLRSQQLHEERNTFIQWTSEAVLRRIYWLQSSVISLGLGVLFLPVAFLQIQDTIVWIGVAIGVLIALLFPRADILLKGVKALYKRIFP